jgi:hypothetical protein
MSSAFFVYTDDETKACMYSRDLAEALIAFLTAVTSGEFEHVRLDYSS